MIGSRCCRWEAARQPGKSGARWHRVDKVRDDLLAANATVEWVPSYMGKRMDDWLRNMGDWNISRKRYFGLPLPFRS